MADLPADPAALLAVLGVSSEQVVAPGYGYGGTFTPRACLAHWTASAAGSDTAASVVAGRCYHACTSRAGVVMLGGWQVRQGHGGEGRTSPQSLARSGRMTVADLDHWHGDPSPDDTSSGANQDFYGVCIDNDGVGERPTDVQWHAFTASLAVFVAMTGGTTPGYLADHAASTNRKIDLVSMTAAMCDAVGHHLELLLGGPHAMTELVDLCLTPEGDGQFILSTAGDVYTYGRATYAGGLGNPDGTRLTSSAPRCIRAHPDGGYYIGVADGGVFTFGGAPFHGSATNDFPH